MNMFEKAYKKTPKGQFTERIFGLEGRQFYNPTSLDCDTENIRLKNKIETF